MYMEHFYHLLPIKFLVSLFPGLYLSQGTAIRERIQESLRGQRDSTLLLQNGKDIDNSDEYYDDDDETDEEYYDEEEYYYDEDEEIETNKK